MSTIKNFAVSTVLACVALGATGASASSPETFRNGQSIFGSPQADAQATRVVDVSKLNSIRVTCGEVLTFANGDKRFTWRIAPSVHRPVDLRKIAPAGFTDERILVYVDSNHLELN